MYDNFALTKKQPDWSFCNLRYKKFYKIYVTGIIKTFFIRPFPKLTVNHRNIKMDISQVLFHLRSIKLISSNNSILG